MGFAKRAVEGASSVWDEAGPDDPEEPPRAPLASPPRRAAPRDHEKILAAIEDGDGPRADALLTHHLAATRPSTLEPSRHATISASLVRENG